MLNEVFVKDDGTISIKGFLKGACHFLQVRNQTQYAVEMAHPLEGNHRIEREIMLVFAAKDDVGRFIRDISKYPVEEVSAPDALTEEIDELLSLLQNPADFGMGSTSGSSSKGQ